MQLFFLTLALECAAGDICNFEALLRITVTGAVLSLLQYGWTQGAFSDRTVICSACTPSSIPSSLSLLDIIAQSYLRYLHTRLHERDAGEVAWHGGWDLR